MAVSTIRPDALIRNDGYSRTTASTGASSSTNANVLGGANDNSPDTYIRKDSGKGSVLVAWGLADPSPAAPSSTEFVTSVVMRLRMSQGSAGSLKTQLLANNAGRTLLSGTISGAVGVQGKQVSTYARSGTTVTLVTASAHGIAVNDEIVVEGVASNINGTWTAAVGTTGSTIVYTAVVSGTITTTAAPSGAVVSSVANKDSVLYACPTTSDGVWTQSVVNDLAVSLVDFTSGTSGSRPRIYEVLSQVYTANLPSFGSAPTVTGAPSSFTTTRPTLNLGSYSQGAVTSGDTAVLTQNGVQVRVFKTNSKADPTVSTDLVWDSGVLANTSTVTLGAPSTAYPSGVDLINSTLYYVYARTATDSSGTGNMRAWSAWGSGTATSTVSFTFAITPPTLTSLTAQWDAATQKVSLTATGAAYAAGSQVFEIQRSNDGGTTWYPVRGASALAPNGSYVATATDYEAARNTTVQYRWRAVGTVSGQQRASEWSSAVSVSTTVTGGGGWTLRSFTTTALYKEILGARVLADVSITQNESVGVFRPLGRTSPLVVHGDMGGKDGTWIIAASGATEWDKLRAVINGQKIVLCLDPFGGYKYVRITGRSWVVRGAYDAPQYEASVDYVEVDGDLVGVTSAGVPVGGGAGYFSPTGTGLDEI